MSCIITASPNSFMPCQLQFPAHQQRGMRANFMRCAVPQLNDAPLHCIYARKLCRRRHALKLLVLLGVGVIQYLGGVPSHQIKGPS